MRRVGLAGGIGSGKSTIAAAFATLGVPVYLCDERARWLQATSVELRERLVAVLGKGIVDAAGQLDRQAMAQQIFADRNRRRAVEAVVHPAVANDFRLWSEERQRQGVPWVLCECAIMKSSGFLALMDNLIMVSLPREERIRRVMLRNHCTRGEVERRIDSQAEEEELARQADWTLIPDDHISLIPTILTINETL